MSQGGWKRHLLKSGLPLEYEVAQLLAQEEMAVSADFSFMRRDGANDKECSVDIQADWYDAADPALTLHLLIECKFRAKNKSLLFVPDPNDEYSPITLGSTIHTSDIAVPYSLPTDGFVPMEGNIPFAYKGVEISDDGAFEEQIWHGIQQLRYAVPSLLINALSFSLASRLDESLAQFFGKILVTNAPIRMLHDRCTIEQIENSSSLEDVSTLVDRVILYSDYGPDYEAHFRETFADTAGDLADHARRRNEELLEAGRTFKSYEGPERVVRAFEAAERWELLRTSTQFFIVTLSGLADLLSDIKEGCRGAHARRIVPAGLTSPTAS